MSEQNISKDKQIYSPTVEAFLRDTEQPELTQSQSRELRRAELRPINLHPINYTFYSATKLSSSTTPSSGNPSEDRTGTPTQETAPSFPTQVGTPPLVPVQPRSAAQLSQAPFPRIERLEITDSQLAQPARPANPEPPTPPPTLDAATSPPQYRFNPPATPPATPPASNPSTPHQSPSTRNREPLIPKEKASQIVYRYQEKAVNFRDGFTERVHDESLARIAKAKPKKERNEHYCNCFRGIMLMSIDDLKSPLFWRAAIAEFVGTMILTMVGCGSCIGYVPETDLVRIALGFGLIVTTVVWGIGHVSGGHVNPAVTMAMVATRRISMARAFFYIIMQLCGAVVGAGILKGVTPESLDSNLGATLLANGMKTVGENQVAYVINPGQGFGIEFFITFILVFTVFATCDSKRNDHNGSSALAIGLSVAVCHLWAVPATGSSMNTARSFGPAVVAGEWKDHWVYWVGPILGGIAAGFVYDHVFAANSSKQKFRTCVLGAEYEGDDFDAVVEKPRKIVESEDDFIEPKSLKEEQV